MIMLWRRGCGEFRGRWSNGYGAAGLNVHGRGYVSLASAYFLWMCGPGRARMNAFVPNCADPRTHGLPERDLEIQRLSNAIHSTRRPACDVTEPSQRVSSLFCDFLTTTVRACRVQAKTVRAKVVHRHYRDAYACVRAEETKT